MPMRGGLTYRKAHLLIELLEDSRLVSFLDIVAINPILDNINKTVELTVDLTVFLSGQFIL